MIWRAVAVGLMGIIVFTSTIALYQQRVIRLLNHDLITAQYQASGCEARLSNIMEDQASDSVFNDAPDSSLPDIVNPEWLLPPSTGSGSE